MYIMAACAKDLKSCLASNYEENQPKLSLDPFWATRLWQHLVQHVKSSVTVSRRRHLFKHYDNVFDGSDLVNVVYQFLSNCGSVAIQKPVSKKNAVKVCQVLMDNKLFECITHKGLQKFEEGSSKLYKFIVEERHDEMIDIENKENVRSHSPPPSLASQPAVFRASMRCSMQSQGKVHLQSIRRTASVRLLNSASKIKDIDRKYFNTSGRSSLKQFSRVHSQLEGSVDSLNEDEHKSLQEQTLMHLLAMIEIPILEGILSVPPNLGKVSTRESHLVICNNPRGIANICLPSKFGNVSNIPWVSAASACLGRQPQGLESLWSLQACKLLCYQTVLEHFSELPEPVVPNVYTPICVAIIEFIKLNKRTKALLACQLFLILLPWQRRQQLRQLLFFLHLVVEDIFVNVDKKITNYEAVSRDFLSSVMCHPCVSKENFQILFDFILYRIYRVFQKPQCLETELVFCQRIPYADFESSFRNKTSQELKELAFFIMDSTAMKLSEKKHWLKLLKKSHPLIYRACECNP